jgi:hypothetical protein
MNLIQIQEHLKDLPLEVVKSYANAQNPEVPPYMALGELERRDRAEQRITEKPTQSVKEKLEAKVGGPQGMPQGAQQGMPQGIPQGMPQGMPQGGAPMPQQAPQGIAQLAQGMPQEMPQQAPAMAGGGLAELPVRDDMFHYAPGGIVAFASGNLVRGPGGELIPEDDTTGEAEARAGMIAASQEQGPPSSAMPQAGLASLTGPATAALARAIRGETDEPMPKDPEAIRQEVLNKHPELAGLINTIPGSTLAALSAKLAAQNEASKAQFQENQKRMRFGALGDALIAAGEATRGQKGIGAAFAGFGKSYSNYTAEDIKRQQAQQNLERQQTIEGAKLDADIETLRQAYAKAQIEGRVSDAIAYQKAIADRIAKRETLLVSASKDALTAANAERQTTNTERQTTGTLDHYKQLEKNAGLTLQELIANHASQRDIERQRLKYQEATKNSEIALRQEQFEALRESRPTADQKVVSRVEGNLNKPGSDFAEVTKRIAGLSAEELDAPVGKYYRSIRDKYRADAYRAAGLPVPQPSTLPTYESFQDKPKEEPGFFSKMGSFFGGGSSAPASKAVPFNQLPQ